MVRTWIEAYWEEQDHPHIKGKTIGEVFNEGRGPGVDPAALDDLMLSHEVKTIGPNGIRFLGADYYDDALVGLRERAIIKYSITDLATVRVYDLEGRSLCTAKRFDSVHPLAAQLGSAKDLSEVRHLQNKQKSLTKATIRIARETRTLISEQKKALPWADIVEAAPRIPDQLDKAHIELLPHEERIPAAAVKPARLTTAQAPTSRDQAPSRPARFGQAIDRYKFIIEHGAEPEDEPFIEAFKKSDTYRQLKEHLDAKERKYAAFRAEHSTTEGGYSR
jgi:putative transposase